MKFTDYKPNWPEWAKKLANPVISEWEKEFTEHIEACELSLGRLDQNFIRMAYYDEPALMALLERALTHSDMEKVWHKISSLDIDPALFSNVLKLAYIGPQGISKKTATQQEEWASRVQSLSLELAAILALTELDDYLFKDFKKANTQYILRQSVGFAIDPKCKCDGKAKACTMRFPYRPPSLSNMLKKLSDDAGRLISGEYQEILGRKENKIYLPSPGKDEAAHLYFIRYLSRFFLEETKGKNLFRVYVKICAEVAYGKTFSIRAIEKIAPINKLL